MANKSLDRNNPLPLYHQLREIIRRRIIYGEWEVGNTIPTETGLIKEFDVSRTTVREAVEALVHEGLLEKRQGRGTFVVRQPLEERLGELTGFAEEVVERNQYPSARVLSAELVKDHFYANHQLRVTEGEQVLRVERVRLADGEPIAVERSFWPEQIGLLLLEYDLDDAWFYQILERHGIYLKEADEQILAVNASEKEAEIFGLDPGAALLEMRRVSYDLEGTPVEYTITRYNAERYSYRVHLRRR